MVGHGGSSAGSYLADPTSPIPSHCASIVVASTLRVNIIRRCGKGRCVRVNKPVYIRVHIHWFTRVNTIETHLIPLLKQGALGL